ncbi:MAG: hypothetical protein ACOCWD_07130, partial [Tangfeifania sp.]
LIINNDFLSDLIAAQNRKKTQASIVCPNNSICCYSKISISGTEFALSFTAINCFEIQSIRKILMNYTGNFILCLLVKRKVKKWETK